MATKWGAPSDDVEILEVSLPGRFADIDLLLNNAGLAPPTDNLQEAEQGPLDGAIETNISGLVARRGCALAHSSIWLYTSAP